MFSHLYEHILYVRYDCFMFVTRVRACIIFVRGCFKECRFVLSIQNSR